MITDNRLSAIVITPSATMLDAFKRMDETYKKLLLVLNNDIFIGLISAGDIQRAIIRNIPLDTSVIKLIRPNIRFAGTDTTIEEIRIQMLEHRMEFMPVVSNEQKLAKVVFWEDLFGVPHTVTKPPLDAYVIIMAGGSGTRMKPITNVIPKPLIPIGEKPIIEHIIDNFIKIGCRKFYLSINYKADLIKYYFDSNPNTNYTINYIQESKPLGTAGSLKLLEGTIKETFFVTNCDILIDQDYRDVWEFHKENQNELTLVSSLKSFSIPYGTLKIGENGSLLELNEKPTFSYFINAGMYIIEPMLLQNIPRDSIFNITDLIEQVKARKGRIGVFPVSEGSLRDIGNWSEYLKHYV